MVLLGMLMASAVVGPAFGQTSSAPTSVTLSYESPDFVGTVSSQNPDCVPGRQVTLFERQVGGGAEAVGATTTSGDGSFSIPQPGADGQYYVTVSARQLPGGYGQSDFCQGTRSDTVPAGSGVLGGTDEDDDDEDADGGIGSLPFTGAQGVVQLTALSLLLIGLGLVLVRRSRRRNTI